VRWPDDEAGISQIDTSFTTDTVFVIAHDDDMSFRFTECEVHPAYARAAHELDPDQLRDLDAHFVAEREDGHVVGTAGVRCEKWNRRGIVIDFYIDRDCRRQGAGHALMGALVDATRRMGMNRLWLETQNVNVPAVRFYFREGFRLCGLDESFYDSDTRAGSEIALFFVRDL
jgi:GNAT superfamily N-acetyltransferase